MNNRPAFIFSAVQLGAYISQQLSVHYQQQQGGRSDLKHLLCRCYGSFPSLHLGSRIYFAPPIFSNTVVPEALMTFRRVDFIWHTIRKIDHRKTSVIQLAVFTMGRTVGKKLYAFLQQTLQLEDSRWKLENKSQQFHIHTSFAEKIQVFL